MDLISVIIPVYQVQDYVEKCLRSVMEQTYNNIEIIVVDDGSKDNSYNICKKLSKEDSRINIYRKKNGGLSDARNYGIEKSTGTYIYFLDSDDYILPDTIEKMYKAVKGKKNTISIMNTYVVWKDKTEIKKNLVYGELKSSDALLLLLQGKIPNYSCGKLFPRKFWDDIKFPVGEYFEDIKTIYKIFYKSKYIISLDDVGYCYVQRKGSITDEAKETRVDAINAYKEQLEFAKVNCKNAVPYIEYRIKETKIRNLFLKDYNKQEWETI